MTMAAGQDPLVVLTVEAYVAEIRLNRPRALNVVDVAMAEALRDVVAQVSADPEVRVIVLSGSGRAFMAGGDLAYFRAAEDRMAAAGALIGPIHEAVASLASAPQPVLASLHGAVAGAGMSLALISDLAIAADNVVFNLAYAKVGNSPDCSGSWTLPRIVGLRKALEIALLSDDISATEALRLGLVNRLVPAAELEVQTRALAQRLAGMAPLAMRGIKRLMRSSFSTPLQQQLDAEAQMFAATADSADFGEALEAFFGRRVPVYHGR